jgi:hypothetical protein
MIEEVWQQFRNSHYAVSTFGNVKNLNNEFKLNPAPNKDGYKLVRIKVPWMSKVLTIHVHRLVAETFIPNPQGLPTVNHIDGVKVNNAVGNLEWASWKDQVVHAQELGLIDHSKKPYPGWFCKLTDAQVFEIKQLMKLPNMSDTILAKCYGLSRKTMWSIRNKKSYAHVPDPN